MRGVPQHPDDDDLLDATQVAVWLDCGVAEIDRCYREDGLPAATVGDDGLLRFRVGEVRAWLRRPDPHGDET